MKIAHTSKFVAGTIITLYTNNIFIYNTAEMFQGGVRFPTGSDSLRTPSGADQVQFLNRRYSPDGRNRYLFLCNALA